MKFFHVSTIANRRYNYIGAVKNDDGVWLHDFVSIG